MGKQLVISEEAESDLEDIWEFIADDSAQNADGFIDQLYRRCLDLTVLDGVGRARNELADGLLSIPYKKYNIFFIRDERRISVVRILRASRDIVSQFESE
ncbi:MAG: type II toxin-antitoxin system RelE/ParE family toxin [Opitutales bacterium]